MSSEGTEFLNRAAELERILEAGALCPNEAVSFKRTRRRCVQRQMMGRPLNLWNIDGAELRRLRRASGWSQLELSCRTGISQAAICTMEKGAHRRVRLRTVTRLAAAFGVDADRLRAAR